MKKITQESINAFLNYEEFHKQNMTVIVNKTNKIAILALHGNMIAILNEGKLQISNAGWFTNTTKERLNALPGVSIYQRNFIWYLNGKEWNGDWTEIKQ